MWAIGSHIKTIEETLITALNHLEKLAKLNKMEISAEITITHLFTMPSRDHQINLFYKGVLLQQSSLSRYLEVTFDAQLFWSNHIKTLDQKGQKRINLLKRQ
ncbi:hypothetical protein NPIL_115551 [Nephila pilipes]|uniref:Uncharacterized protein n=1 Tax=Nephila pilipes TaxID=299642 RepID=A0A8X6QMK6_NEPPI|nr:hypothetical protein NPIL_115551 [Nephila pilipes]